MSVPEAVDEAKGFGEGIYYGFVQNPRVADLAVLPFRMPRRIAFTDCCDAHKSHRVMVFIRLRAGNTP